ncbi:MAG TPA: M23 family metallopeptidase [bacterium]|nr:M23 family metallopeptidase [bacterium]
MSYLFTNPQLKRWKTLFWISFFLNVVLGVALYIGDNEKPLPAEHPAEPALAHAEAPAAAKEPERPAGPAVGEAIPVWLTITDNFYNAFATDPDIARLAVRFDFPRLAEILSVHVSRILIWDLALNREVMKGDTLSFVFRMIPADELKQRDDMPDSLEVLAVSYFSNRYNKFIDLYAYRPASEKYHKYYYGDGQMSEKRMKPPPIREQAGVITLFDDRPPKHEGVDFKAPTGTPVYATFDGRVTRTDWQVRFNGYSVEITARNGVHTAKYLHLSERLVEHGQEVRQGDVIAKSGNTGKASLPHLHYQVSVGTKGKLLDPFKYHETYHDYLKGDELRKFQEMVVDYKKLLKKVVDG